jgi:NADPH-dependent 2,4-dienoyl-CoA reductase/sulfur reductase-like enzyme
MGTRLLVVGGAAAGMSAALQARRRAPDLEIVVVERGRWTSSSAAGAPHLISGAVSAVDELVARTPEDLRARRIDVRTGHEVVTLDLAGRRAEVHNLTHGRTFQLGFDLLCLATGARPSRPEVEGIHSPHVHGVQTLDDATRLLDDARRRRPDSVAVLGGDYVGLLMAEAFAGRGTSVTVVEPGAEVMPSLDREMAAAVARAMRSRGIDVRAGTAILAVGEKSVSTSAGEVAADMVVLGSGVTANGELGSAAGLETGAGGALAVDRRLRTAAEGVWAAGDCCLSTHLISGRPVHQPLGTVADKQGRVAGINISGGYATFPGVLGTAAAAICGVEAARTGLGQAQAEAAGFAAVAATVESTTAAGYLPDASSVAVKLLAERGSGRLLGAQLVGGPGAAKRIDVMAAAATGRLTVEDLLGMDLSYAPPVSPLRDPLQVAARALLSKL